jgi:Mn2+/Fe2+ NRAMP family transporter
MSSQSSVTAEPSGGRVGVTAKQKGAQVEIDVTRDDGTLPPHSHQGINMEIAGRLAQALNGILLPLVAVFLLIAVNDRQLMGEEALNGTLSNTLMAMVVAITITLGVSHVLRASAAALGFALPPERAILGLAAAVTVLIALPLYHHIRRRRAG